MFDMIFFHLGRHNVAYNRDAEDVRISKTNFQSSSEAYKRGMANSAMDSSEWKHTNFD